MEERGKILLRCFDFVLSIRSPFPPFVPVFDERFNPRFLNGRGFLLSCGVFFRVLAMFVNSAGRFAIGIGNCQAEIFLLIFAPHLVRGLLRLCPVGSQPASQAEGLSQLLYNLPQVNPGGLFSKRNLQTLPLSGLDDGFDFCIYEFTSS